MHMQGWRGELSADLIGLGYLMGVVERSVIIILVYANISV